MGSTNTRLVVFADDWGVHPSSTQHLVRHLQNDYSTMWVNTTGTRRPKPTLDDLRKIIRRIAGSGARRMDPRLTVLTPAMWPGFRTPWQRRVNALLVSHAVNRSLGRRRGERRIALTTLPITADLVGRVDVDEWVYYCVDEFWSWPGLDGAAMSQMDAAQVVKVDRLIAASVPLQHHLARLGREAPLLTHGVDLDHWYCRVRVGGPPAWLARLPRPVWMFWGQVDRRLDMDWCRGLSAGYAGPGTLVLVGPGNAPEHLTGSVVAHGAVDYAQLPSLAVGADVLVLPYIDAPVTRAAQPLKLKEYLATLKPVVTRGLPATREWADAADVVDTQADFVRAVRHRSAAGATPAQLRARERLRSESWSNKAQLFEQLLLGQAA
jgi:hypothetical protein